jgi:hypothetical protein
MTKRQRRILLNVEVSEGEEKMIDHMAKKEGITRSQYVRESVYLNLFMGGDLQVYKFLGTEFRVATKQAIADKVAKLGRRGPVAA